MKTLRAITLSAIGLLLVGWSFYVVLHQSAPAKYASGDEPLPLTTSHTLRVGEYVLPIEIAETPEERSRGFSGREKPLSGQGLLFVFEKSGQYGFWMKGMRFAIDIVWIDADWRVVEVTRDVRPESYPQTFTSAAPVAYVLELPTGDANLFNIDVGTKLYLDR